MLSTLHKAQVALLISIAVIAVSAQQSDLGNLISSGQALIDGRSSPYLIRHLPVNAFPQLPPAIQDELTRRGCIIPQTYEAHHPENVVHASLQRPGSSDWAVLCTVKGEVSLLVFFSGSPGDPMVLATAPETERLQPHGSGSVLGFSWAIDPASPQDVHEAQFGMKHPPPLIDHDALADSVIDQRTIFHFYSRIAWTLLDTQD